MKLTIALCALTLSLAACSHKQVAKEEKDSTSNATTPAAVNAAAAANASHVAEIRFKDNSAELTEEARQTLVNTIDAAQKIGVVDEVKVLAWADKDYPSTKARKLSKGERDLAGERAENVRGFIKSLFTVDDIDTYNMAKRPNAIARLFSTDDARVKRAMESAGIPNSDSLKSMRSSKAAHAIVMVITQ